VAKSTCEAEYAALTAGTAEALWLQALLRWLHISIPAPIPIFVDNSAAVALSENALYHSRTKHCALDMAFVREHVLFNRVKVCPIPTQSQVADFLTKPLANKQHQQCMKMAGQQGGTPVPDQLNTTMPCTDLKQKRKPSYKEALLQLRGSVEET
jgi:hypothetical protein